MLIHTNKRFMPKTTDNPLQDNENLINCIKHVLLDSRGVPKDIPHWEWIQHYVDPFVNTYSPRHIRILQEGWTLHDIRQCGDFVGIILSNLPSDVQNHRRQSLSQWIDFCTSLLDQESLP